MNLHYKRGNKISKMYKNFMWRHGEFLCAIGWIIGLFVLSIGIIIGSLYLQRDVTKPDEVKDVKKTTIMVKKKNGLWDGFIITSNGDITVETMDLRKDILVIKEKGKNGIGVEIDMETQIENVDSFYIEKGT